MTKGMCLQPDFCGCHVSVETQNHMKFSDSASGNLVLQIKKKQSNIVF